MCLRLLAFSVWDSLTAYLLKKPALKREYIIFAICQAKLIKPIFFLLMHCTHSMHHLLFSMQIIFESPGKKPDVKPQGHIELSEHSKHLLKSLLKPTSST